MIRTPSPKHQGFADWLARLVKKEDRGTLAALRRGLMLDEERLFQLYGSLPPSFLVGLAPGEERLYLMVAALFASHPESFPERALGERRRNLGDSLRLLAQVKNPGASAEDMLPDSLKRRVEALLAAPRDEVFGHLRQIIGLLNTEAVPVDWAMLLHDLREWERDGHLVQWEWSRAFYVGHHAKEGDERDVS